VRTVSDGERRARLATRHALASDHRVASVEAAVAAMTCLHATEPSSVHLSAHARSGATRDDIRRALHEDRTVVLQLAMRRTVFAFPRDLLPAVWGSAAARVAAQLGARLAKEVEASGLADDGVAWVADLCAAVHSRLGEAPATTQQLREALPELALRLEMAPGKTYGGQFPIAPRVLSVLAAAGGVLRGEPAAGWKVSRPIWTTAEDWLGCEPERLGDREGYAELVRRWLWSFGPGTEADLVWWLGGTKGAVRQALADIDAVEVLLADARPAWVRDDDIAEVAATEPWAALLPALDPTTMGWKGRDFYLGDLASRLFDTNGNAGPTAWWDGRIVGGWTQTPDGAVVVVPAVPLPSTARRALTVEAERLTAWLDGEIVRSPYQSPLVRQHEAAAGGPAGGATAGA
jgi:Winged helix DNA-binding domain